MRSTIPPERAAYRKILGALFVVFVFINVAALGYYLIESKYSWLDSLYMTVISITTAGHLEVGGGLTNQGRVWTMFVILGGVATGAVAMSLIVAIVVEGRVRSIFGRQQLERKIAALSGHVIVCGYGRMGHSIALGLQKGGREVVVVDNDPQRTAQAEQEGLLYVFGDAQEEAALLSAGAERASTLVATLTDDAKNVFLTLSARGLSNSLRIIARAQDVATQDKLTRAGATRVICPQIIGGNRIIDMLLRPAVVDFVEMAHKGVNLEMDQLTLEPDCGMVGRTLRDLALPARVGAMVVAIRRPDGQATYNPKPDMVLSTGDTLILIGKHGMAEAIEGLRKASEA